MSKMISFVSIALVSFAASSSFAALTCGGLNQKGTPLVLKIVESKTRPSGYKSVSIEKLTPGASNPVDNGQGVSKPLEGCQDALLAGEKNGELNTDYSGNLYIECDGDGDAGVLNLKKKSATSYTGTFMAPNGKPALGLDDDEEVSLNCTVK